METLATPFAIGETFYLPRQFPEKVIIPCPVCVGQLAVVVLLGDGERVGVPCDACGVGYLRPRGVIEEWVHTPGAVEFVIARVKSMHDDRWYVESVTGGSCEFSNLVKTEAEALARSVRLCAEQHEANMRTRQRHRGDVKKHTWSVRYHREQIRELERQIAWHSAKIATKATK